MDDYLSKPVRPEDLDRVLERWAPAAAAPVAAEAPAAAAPSSHWDPRYLESLRALESPSDPGLVREIVADFLQSAPRQIASLRAAAGDGDGRSVEQLAHKLKGSCGLLGVTGLAALLQDLELASKGGACHGPAPALERIEREFQAVRPALEAAIAA